MGHRDIIFIKVRNKDAELFLKLLNNTFRNRKVLNQRVGVQHEDNNVLFPIINEEELLKILCDSIGEKVRHIFVSRVAELKKDYKAKTIEETIENKFPKDLLKLVPKSYDIIGDIALIEFDDPQLQNIPNSENFKKEVSKGLIKVNKRVKTVFEKLGKVSTKYRLRDLRLLGGKGNTETVYKENHCIFKLDVMTTYFTPRLVFERKRITSCRIAPKEKIADLFAGVGPFSIQIAYNHNVSIFSFDINPKAYRYLVENIKMNKLKGEIYPYNIDIREIIEPSNEIGKFLKKQFDRVIMNLPEKSLDYLDVACFLLKGKGIIHNYQFCEKENAIDKAITNIKVHLNRIDWQIENILTAKIVKPYSPKADLVVVDLYIKQLS
ncbi:MAG: class I SAM-dependent methyltransferase family protein [Promethearchaeota archaeon]